MTDAGTSKVIGPRVFDVVPYILIENSMKYSPSDDALEIDYRESGSDIIVLVRNVGTRLEEYEKESVFLPGVRRAQAVESDVRGTGLGIYFARMVVERYLHGSITLGKTNDYSTVDGLDFCTTEVTLRLPMV